MYYELYVDVLFLVNFTMDYLLLLLVRKMLTCSATHGNVCLGAAVGAGLTCVIVILPLPNAFVEFILFHIAVNTCMIRVGLKIKEIRSFCKALILLYIGSFLMGGILEAFRPYVKTGSLMLALAIVGYYVSLGIWNFLTSLLRWNQYHCRVELYVDGEKYELKGLIDTGNGLSDEVSGKPVSIVDKNTAIRLWGERRGQWVRFVSYQSIGKKNGVLPVFEAEKMCVIREKVSFIEHPLIGVSEETFSDGKDYEMILNPNLF